LHTDARVTGGCIRQRSQVTLVKLFPDDSKLFIQIYSLSECQKLHTNLSACGSKTTVQHSKVDQ